MRAYLAVSTVLLSHGGRLTTSAAREAVRTKLPVTERGFSAVGTFVAVNMGFTAHSLFLTAILKPLQPTRALPAPLLILAMFRTLERSSIPTPRSRYLRADGLCDLYDLAHVAV